MKGKLAIGLAVSVLLLLAIFHLWGPSSVPQGQEPLVTLSRSSISDFQKAFDAQTDGARMVQLLNQIGDPKLSVLVVWEPILPTDWRRPSRSTLARLPDRRVRQFWDPGHVIASALSEFAKLKPEQPRPKCCVQKGFNWDEAILYAPHS